MKVFRAGIDIGSTTVKLVLLSEKNELIFGKYIRHGRHDVGVRLTRQGGRM